MQAGVEGRRHVRLGPFEVDLQLGEVRANGHKAKLQEQPLQILALLLERPGELVTREEIRSRLWPDGIVVDFEHSINTAVKKLREALGDSPENPRFIETLPRHGYRLIAPVTLPVRSAGAVREPPLRRWWRMAAMAAIAFISLVLGVTGWFWSSRSRQTTPEVSLTAVPLTSYPGSEESPSFSPDGTQVAFSWNGEKEDNFDIYVKAIGSEPPLRLTTNPAREFSPAWSPDGRWIAFCRDLPGSRYAVVLIRPIPGPERIVTQTPYQVYTLEGPLLAWSPDSHWLAIVSRESPNGVTALFLLSPETGEKRRLTSPPAGTLADSCPAFSPDGRTLAFARMPAWTYSELYSLDLSPDFKPLAEPKRITSGKWVAQSPVWIDEGRALVFSAWAGADNALWRVDRSGTGRPERLATLGNDLGMPATSRAGHPLAYVHEVVDSNIWRLENPLFGGTNPPRKFIVSTRRDEFPQFSPDGKKIAFLSDRSGSLEIWVCDTDGSNPSQLTSFGKGVVGPARWSPDGNRLAFESTESTLDGHPEVYIVSADGGRPKRLTSTVFGANNPSWSHDGRWILYDDPTNSVIYKAPVTGGPPVQVTSRKAWAPLESSDGKYIYSMDGTDAFALRRDPTEGGPGERILPPLVHWSGFALVKGGIYFIPRPDPNSAYSIQFFDATTGKIRRVASFDGFMMGLAVSPDQRWILYTRLDQRGSDLMLVENFR